MVIISFYKYFLFFRALLPCSLWSYYSRGGTVVSRFIGTHSTYHNLKVGVAVSISKVQLRLGAIQNVYSLHEFAGNINLSLVQIGPNQNHNVLRFHFYSSFLFVRFCVPHLFCDFSIAFSKSVSVVIMVLIL